MLLHCGLAAYSRQWELLVYTDNCGIIESEEGEGGEGGEGGSGGSARMGPSHSPLSTDAGQQYTLLPNPNDGNMQLMQALEDDVPVTIAILNALGQEVYKGNKTFEQGQTSLTLNLAPGLYHITLRDSQGQSYSLKFVKR